MNNGVVRQEFARRVTAAVALAMALYHIYVIIPPMDFISPELREVFRGPPTDYIFRAVHLLFALVLTFLYYRWRSPTDEQLAMLLPDARAEVERRHASPSLLDLLLVAASVAAVGYIFIYYDYIINRIIYVDDMTLVDQVLSVTLILLVLEGTRRVLGPALPLTAIAFLAYGLFGTNIEPIRFIDQLYLSTEGIFGQPLAVSASYVMIFVLFGAFMERTGTGQLFMDFAMAITGHTAGGPGKVSVVSSSLFGTISGSAVANVMVDGPISIPLMKRTGFKAHFAAAVEAVASTGGQIMPPIMGAAAFVMAEFQGVSYLQVVIWAAIPAILYYIACFGAVHFEAKRQGLHGVPRSELPRVGETLASRGHLFIPVLSILFVMYSGYSAPLAALTGTLLCFPVAWLGPVVVFLLPALMVIGYAIPSVPQIVPPLFGIPVLAEAAIITGLIAFWLWAVRGRVILLKPELRPVLDALVDGARNTLPVALACACAGIIIGIVILTGLGITFTQWVVGLSQDTLILALILTMMAGIVLGMGMPTTPAYIIMVALLVPALIKLGVVRPAAHMFAFYFAILSAITPPVALAVYAASGLARSDLWKTGWAAVKVGAAGFIVPFMFVYEPALLMIGDWPTIVWRFIVSCIGVGILAAGLHGYLFKPMTYWQRALAISTAFMLVVPDIRADIAGFVLMGLVVLAQQFGPDAEKLAPAAAKSDSGSS
jgi:TRAP transporter 4TM/12TM fusion protein